MNVEQVVPAAGLVPVETLISEVTDPKLRAVPFCDIRKHFISELSRSVQGHAQLRQDPAMVALAFWMRASATERLAQEFQQLEPTYLRRVPRGVIFQIAPSNVETMFVYAWALSFLTGNMTLSRVSTQLADSGQALCQLLDELLASDEFSSLRGCTRIVQYDRDMAITSALSAACDVRMTWGGDATVSAIRQAPLRPHAIEVPFHDRFSLSVVDAQSFLDAPADRQSEQTRRFFNDVYWFDQTGCSSPRLLIWRGNPSAVDEAGYTFYNLLQQQILRAGYHVDTGGALSKLTHVYGSFVDRAGSYVWHSNELVVVRLQTLTEMPRDNIGLGLIYESRVDDLMEIEQLVRRKDQTLTYFGLDSDELTTLAVRLNGRGVDRMVPFGQALSFGRYWDGFDLLRELTRVVEIRDESATGWGVA